MNDEPYRIRIGDHVSIYQRGAKRIWCAEFWRNGEHCRLSMKTADKKIASQRARKLDVELATGTFQQAPPEVNVAQAIEQYLAFLTTETRSPRTLTKYAGILATLNEILTAHRISKLHQFTAAHFDLFRSERKKNHRAGTMYTEGVLIKQFFKWCKSRKLIRENPIADFKLVKPTLMPKAGPSLLQIDAMLAASNHVMRIMLAVLAFCGLRSGELRRLRKEDVDLAGNWIHVVSREGAETKSKRSRKIPLHPRLRAILNEHNSCQGPLLFTAQASDGYPNGDHSISTKKLNDRFKALLNRLAMPVGRDSGFTIHSLRRSFETITINANTPQRVVDTWMGHQADKSMAAVYYKLRDEESQSFMEKVPFGAGLPAADAGPETAI